MNPNYNNSYNRPPGPNYGHAYNQPYVPMYSGQAPYSQGPRPLPTNQGPMPMSYPQRDEPEILFDILKIHGKKFRDENRIDIDKLCEELKQKSQSIRHSPRPAPSGFSMSLSESEMQSLKKRMPQTTEPAKNTVSLPLVPPEIIPAPIYNSTKIPSDLRVEMIKTLCHSVLIDPENAIRIFTHLSTKLKTENCKLLENAPDTIVPAPPFKAASLNNQLTKADVEDLFKKVTLIENIICQRSDNNDKIYITNGGSLCEELLLPKRTLRKEEFCEMLRNSVQKLKDAAKLKESV